MKTLVPETYLCLSCHSSANFSRSLRQITHRIEQLYCVFCHRKTAHERMK